MPAAAIAFRKELLPPARTFYEGELDKLSRPNLNGWAMGNCTFHKSKSGKSFSVNVSFGAFHCWGCERPRDGLSFKKACQQLGCWSRVSEAEPLKLDSEAGRRKGERDQAAQLKESGLQLVKRRTECADWFG